MIEGPSYAWLSGRRLSTSRDSLSLNCFLSTLRSQMCGGPKDGERYFNEEIDSAPAFTCFSVSTEILACLSFLVVKPHSGDVRRYV